MERKKQKKLVSELLSHNNECNVDIDVWRPTIKDIKFILALGLGIIDPNSESPICNIFNIKSDMYKSSHGRGVRVTLFCNEPEAEFMHKYIKRRKERENDRTTTAKVRKNF